MNYQITNLTEEKIDENDLVKVIEKVSELLGVESSIVSIVLVDNEYIHKINKEYRNVDRETDVISFAFMDDETNPESGTTDLGEIYISLEKAHSQSKEYGHSFKRELCFLLTHGLLHLLGYDHMTEEDEKEMFGLQEEVLNSLGIGR
ncbi:MAG: rRNA maturation RNase YbeY [Tenericutes bacterium]|nr:rRNA maturation RNase YbeY [Mycoplasmatota bacterium]